MRACLEEEIEGISEIDLVLTKLNDESKEVGTIRVIKAQLLSTSEAALETPNGLNGSFSSSGVCDFLLPPPPPVETPRMTRPQFEAYANSGLEIDLCYAIDFTSSNGMVFVICNAG